jgi:hypothetical protein
MIMRSIFALVFAMFMLSGCATMLDLGSAVCDAAFGGSEAGGLCEELDKLKADEEAPAE